MGEYSKGDNTFYRNPEIKANKDNIIHGDISQDSFIQGMKNTCAEVLRIAYESLVHAVLMNPS